MIEFDAILGALPAVPKSHDDRRPFLSTAAMAVAGGRIGVHCLVDSRSTQVRPVDTTKMKRKAAASFGPLKQIDAGVLNIGYAEEGQVAVLRCCFRTAGLTTSTRTSSLLRCWQRLATA